MSIEKDLGRIATALEKIADYMANKPPQVVEAPQPSTSAAPQQEAPAAPITHAAPPAPAAAPAPTAAPTAAPMTAEQLNEVLVAEFKRIGKREPIDQALNSFGVVGVQQLPAEKYQELVDKVKAIPAS